MLIAAFAVASCASAAEDAGTYRSEDVVFDNLVADGVRLAGTLSIPDGDGPFPAAVLLTGAGPQDRDATSNGHKPFAVLADHLSARGIAVLRHDDRGAGASTGVFETATWTDLASDANAAVLYLHGRSEIDPDRIGLIGHSQGGIVAPLAAMENPDIAFVVSLAGPSTDFIELTLSQRRVAAEMQGASAEAVERTEPVLRAVFTAMAAARDQAEAEAAAREALTADALATLGATEAARETLVAQLASDAMFEALHLNPQRTLPHVDVPVLALTGSNDGVVDADANLAAIEAALAHNGDVTTVKLDGVNHFFQTAEENPDRQAADVEESFAPAALEAISEWINARFAARRP
jgi:pimeloyl-ACP methyl ester carboxylesterase